MLEIAKAIAVYDRYPESELPADERASVRARRDQLSEALEASRAPAPEAPAPAPPSEGLEPPVATTVVPERSPRTGPWVLTGLGAGALAASVVTGLVGRERHRSAVNAPDHRSVVRLTESADRFELATTVTFISGVVVLAAIGILWRIFDARAARRLEVSGDRSQLRLGLRF